MDKREDKREAMRKRVLAIYARTGSIRATRRESGHSIGLIRDILYQRERVRKAPARTARPRKLDRFEQELRRLVIDDGLTAVLALEELRALGYDGGYTAVKAAARRLRPSRGARPTTRVEHPPGAEGQMDWSSYRVQLAGILTEVQAFSLVLPYSRWMFVRFALDQTLPTLLRLHDEAFGLMGAVPRMMSYDNMTTVGRHEGAHERLNPNFAAYAGEYGFEVKLTRPYKPNDHASVERPFSYVEGNCLKRRRFRFDDLDDLNRFAAWWCEQVANVRVHGATRRRPVDLFAIEKTYLLPLPGDRPEACHTVSRAVQSDHCVAVNTNRYSVSPRYCGRPATVRIYASRVEILIDGEVVAVHALAAERHQRLVLPEHEEEFKRHTPSRLLLEQAFLRLGPVAEAFYAGLRAQRGHSAGHHIKRLLHLADRHGNEAIIAAMRHVAGYGAHSADAVVRVLSGVAEAPAPVTPCGEMPMPPERVRAWLQGLEVQGRDLADYDAMIEELSMSDDGDNGDNDDDCK